MSTSIEHELAIRALESIHLSCASIPTLTSLSRFASNKSPNFSFLWFVCNHDATFGLHYDKLVSLLFHLDDLCVATNMMTNCSFKCLVGNRIDIFCMPCHECFGSYPFGVATTISNTCSFLWVVCTHVDNLDISHRVFLPTSPFIASRILTNFSFQCLVCNVDHMGQILLGILVFPHLEDIPRNCLHIDRAYALTFIYLCCANGVMNMSGHVIDDMILYLAHTLLVWSLMCRSFLWMSFHDLLQPRIPMTDDHTRRVHTTRSTYLPPCHDDEQESRTTLFKGGEMM